MNYEITEEQIKENKRLTLEQYFKEVFETKLEVGKWYKSIDKKLHIFYVTELKDNRYYYYGFNTLGHFEDKDWFLFIDVRLQKGFKPATYSEVLEALTNEFKKQNPKVKLISAWFVKDENILTARIDNEVMDLFNNGIWTKFHTKEEAEKLLNAKIV